MWYTINKNEILWDFALKIWYLFQGVAVEIHYLKNILPDGGLCAVTEYGEHNINGSLHPTDDAHIHDYCEVYFNVSGNVSFAVENKVYPVNTGDIIISKPNEIHYCIYHSDQIHTCYCFWVKVSAKYSYLLSPCSSSFFAFARRRFSIYFEGVISSSSLKAL